jgi:hypothetical protein
MSGTENEEFQTPKDHAVDCLDVVDFDSFKAQSPVASMYDYGSESDLEPALSPDLDELDVGHSMGGTQQSVNKGPTGGRGQQRRPGFGACGTVFKGTYQLPSLNKPFVFGRPQSASNTSHHQLNPSSGFDNSPSRMHPHLQPFPTIRRANRPTAPLAHSQSLIKYTGGSNGASGKAASFGERPSQGGMSKKRTAKDLDEDSDEGVSIRLKRLNLEGGNLTLHKYEEGHE